ncbi:hypothetical protein [Acidipila sp. EB88]|uniref:hypothetical protein n=1 Tax=Acidipila sp. EB88 TaxID=2305226 RepID=UPI0013157C7A|nr:hypothetical protein [Acidipila sp. EB88]
MMYRKRSLSSLQSGAARNAATVAVTSQNSFPMSSKTLFVLPFQGVASTAKTQGVDLGSTAWAVKNPL